MKKIFICAIFWLLTVPATFGQFNPLSHLYLNGGIAIPSAPSEFSNFWSNGFVVGVGLKFDVAPVLKITNRDLTTEIRLTLDYNQFPFETSNLPVNGELLEEDESLDISIFRGNSHALIPMVQAKVGYKLSDVITPYGFLGAGLMRFSVSDATIKTQGTENDIKGGLESAGAFSFGLGFDFKVSPKHTIFLEGVYTTSDVIPSQSPYQIIPLKVGLYIRR